MLNKNLILNNIYLNLINEDDIKKNKKYILNLLNNTNNITYIDKINNLLINNKNLKIEYNNNIIGIILVNDNNYISIILDKLYVHKYLYIYILKYFITFCNVIKNKKILFTCK